MALIKALLGAVALVGSLALTAQAQTPEKLRVAVTQRGAWDTGVAEMGQKAGIFRKHGLDIEILYTQAGPEAIQALIAGSVDVATGAGVAAGIGTIAKGAPLKIISNEILGAPDQYWYVPAESPVRTIADLKGKTVAFSLPGSSSNIALLALMDQYKLDSKPTSTGSIASTLTQVLTKQVEVGFSAVPFFLDKVDSGEIRIVATGEDVAVLKTRTGRVNLTNLQTLANRRPALVRFHAAYKDVVDWMYAAPEALAMFGEISGLPPAVVGKVRGLLPKETMSPETIVGIEQIIVEAIQGKFIPSPFTVAQVEAMIDIPSK
jgi:NitT/TauT family transport system substrate-binding protein